MALKYHIAVRSDNIRRALNASGTPTVDDFGILQLTNFFGRSLTSREIVAYGEPRRSVTSRFPNQLS